MASSRPYNLTIKETLQRTIIAEDSIETTLTIPPILSPERTEGILRRVLKERGFEDDGEGMSRSSGGVDVDVDPSTGKVTISAKDSEEASESGEGNLPQCPPCAERAKEQVRESLRERLGTALDERERELIREVTERLEGSLAELGCELERIGNSVTSSAVKQKAKELGEIKSITQDEETGMMTIVVEVA